MVTSHLPLQATKMAMDIAHHLTKAVLLTNISTALQVAHPNIEKGVQAHQNTETEVQVLPQSLKMGIAHLHHLSIEMDIAHLHPSQRMGVAVAPSMAQAPVHQNIRMEALPPLIETAAALVALSQRTGVPHHQVNIGMATVAVAPSTKMGIAVVVALNIEMVTAAAVLRIKAVAHHQVTRTKKGAKTPPVVKTSIVQVPVHLSTEMEVALHLQNIGMINTSHPPHLRAAEILRTGILHHPLNTGSIPKKTRLIQ